MRISSDLTSGLENPLDNLGFRLSQRAQLGQEAGQIGLDSQKLSNYFTKKATVALGEPLESASSSDEIASLFQYVKRSVDAMEVKILRKDVAVEADRKNAKMDLMIRAKIKPTAPETSDTMKIDSTPIRQICEMTAFLPIQ